MWRGTVERCVSSSKVGFRTGRWPQADLPRYVYKSAKRVRCTLNSLFHWSSQVFKEIEPWEFRFIIDLHVWCPINLFMQIHAMTWDM